jgi:putative oxidoreductase
MDHGILILVARICLSAGYIYSGIDKSVNWRQGIAFCIGLRLPLPELVLAGTIVLQLAAGLMVVLGWHARVGAAVLLVFSVVATLIAHNPFGRKADDFRREAMWSLEHLAIVGGLLLIVARGPGAIALMP